MERPFGTVSFLFTDIEGSTRLWEEHPSKMRIAVARHDALLRETVERHGGLVFKTVGDGLCAAFQDASHAVSATLEGQQTLRGGDLDLKVRMAVHTGSVERRDNDYFGQPLNRVARLLSIAHGGQVLISHVSHDLCRDSLPAGCTLKPLGEHLLKDLVRPESVYQLCHAELAEDFPPLRSLLSLPTNLPQQVTSFIGREKELRTLEDLFQKRRLITLTGCGGCGKTRLALQAAADLLDSAPDGVWLAELAPLVDPALVTQAVAGAIRLKDAPGKDQFTSLIDHLRPRQLVIILDNCEHLLDACARLADAIQKNCPKVLLLATSREGLGIAGETLYRVPSLPSPASEELQTAESLLQSEAVRLFVERAEQASPSFQVTDRNAPALASICQRLDGIPLAIELAAARMRSLTVEEVDQRLDERFRLLTGGSRTAIPRQQTLRSLIDWSYFLLNEPQKALLCRLSVFARGWTIEAAEQVCSGGSVDELEVLDLLSSLSDKSLVITEEREGRTRYRLLETVRQYARARLYEDGEAGAVRTRHMNLFVQLADSARVGLFGSEQGEWLQRLETEHDNLRAAVEWSQTRPEGDAALRLGAGLWRFWSLRGFLSEGRDRLRAILAHPGALAPSADRVRVLDGAGLLTMQCGDMGGAETLYEEAVSIGRTLGDGQLIALALNGLGDTTRILNKKEEARAHHQEALKLSREVGDMWNMAYALTALGMIAVGSGDSTEGLARLEEGLAIKRKLGDQRSIAYSLEVLGRLAERQNRPDARVLLEESLRMSQELRDERSMAWTLASLGSLTRREGNLERAMAHYIHSFTSFVKVGARSDALWALKEIADFMIEQQESKNAAPLYGLVHSMRPLGDGAEDSSELSRLQEELRRDLGHEAFQEAWAKGAKLSLEQVAALLVDFPSSGNFTFATC